MMMHKFYFALILVCCCFFLAKAAPPTKVNHDHYDQRQNGTENYRVNIDGVVVAVAPAEALLASAADFEDILGLLDYDENNRPESGPVNLEHEPDKIEASSSTTTQSPTPKHSLKKVGLRRRLANFILPILRRNRQ